MAFLAETYPIEQARCRELLAQYKEIPTGAFGAAAIEIVLQNADKAASTGDVVAMLRSYQEMKNCQ